jgi:hypothetical protein
MRHRLRGTTSPRLRDDADEPRRRDGGREARAVPNFPTDRALHHLKAASVGRHISSNKLSLGATRIVPVHEWLQHFCTPFEASKASLSPCFRLLG